MCERSDSFFVPSFKLDQTCLQFRSEASIQSPPHWHRPAAVYLKLELNHAGKGQHLPKDAQSQSKKYTYGGCESNPSQGCVHETLVFITRDISMRPEFGSASTRCMQKVFDEKRGGEVE